MPIAKLLSPASLTMGGRVWRRGVEVPADIETARILHGNPRFEVTGLKEALTADDAPPARTGQDGTDQTEPKSAKPGGVKITKAPAAKKPAKAPKEPASGPSGDRASTTSGDEDPTTEDALEV